MHGVHVCLEAEKLLGTLGHRSKAIAVGGAVTVTFVTFVQ